MNNKLVLALLASLLFLSFSCSSDKNKYVFVPKNPGENIEKGTIQLVFQPSALNNTLVFTVDTDSNEPYKVDWGDKNNPQPIEYRGSKYISYTYEVPNQRYVITLDMPHLRKIHFWEEGSPQLKAIYFGDISTFEQFSMEESDKNTLEIIDVNNCPQMWKVGLYLTVNTENYDFSGVKKLKTLFLTVNKSVEVKLSDSELEDLQIASNAESIGLDVSNSKKLKRIIHARESMDGKELTRVLSMNIENTPIEKMTLSNLSVSKLDLRNTESLKELTVRNFEIKEELSLPKSLVSLGLDNYMLNVDVENIKTVDFSDLDKLERIEIGFIPSLESLDIESNKKLEYISANQNVGLERIYLSNLPSLKRIESRNNESLRDVKLEQLKSLKDLEMFGSKKLNGIEIDKNQTLSNVDISYNNMGEEAIKNIFNQLEDAPNNEGVPRKIKIIYNPGNTDAVRDIINESENWEIVSD